MTTTYPYTKFLSGTDVFSHLNAELAKVFNARSVDTDLNMPDYVIASLVTRYLTTLAVVQDFKERSPAPPQVELGTSSTWVEP